MRLSIILIQYFLLNYFCYCHDLSHAEQVITNQPEPPETNYLLDHTNETTNIRIDNNESSNDTGRKSANKSEQIVDLKNSTTDNSLDDRVPLSLENDLITPLTPIKPQDEQQLKVSTEDDTLRNSPISFNDKTNPKMIRQDQVSPQKNSQTMNSIEQNHLNDDSLSAHQEQVQSSSDHIPLPPSKPQIPTKNSISNDIKLDENSENLVKPIINDNTIVQSESHIPVPTTSQILRSASSKLHHRVHRNPQNVQTNQPPIDNSSLKVESNHSENVTIQSSDDDIERSSVLLSQSEESQTELHLQLTTNLTMNNETQTNNVTSQNLTQIENSTNISNSTYRIVLTKKTRQICWHLPKPFETSIELLENQIFRFINLLPNFVQTILFGQSDDREIIMNTIWFISICSMCFLLSIIFLAVGTNRLKQTKFEKEIRARCQQLQQYNNRVLLESETFERQNQKLSDEIDELKSKVTERNSDEDIFSLREECIRFQEDIKLAHAKQILLQQDIDSKQNLIQKYENDTQRQVEIIAHLNDQIFPLKQELDQQRNTVARLQSNDLSIERFEKLRQTIEQLQSEIIQLKKEKLVQNDQSQEIQAHVDQLDIEKSELILRMKHIKDLFEQRDQTLKHIQEKINKDKTIELEDLRSILKEKFPVNHQNLLLNIDIDVKKCNQRISDLHNEINVKNHRMKELDSLLTQEKDRCKEIETKLKLVLELRERDAHLHVRQLGQSDAELRSARTDTERVRILQNKLELKQQQLDELQKSLTNEQMKFNEEYSKLQHATHEKCMEVKRLIRELESSKKESESLRRQITKYAKDTRSSHGKSMLNSGPQHIQNNGELESQNTSPISQYQEENFRPIDQKLRDSGCTSPTEMFNPNIYNQGPPLFNLSGPPFYPPPFMPPPQHSLFMMHPRFSMTPNNSYGFLSPMTSLATNGSDVNNSEIADSSNVSPNSTSYDQPLNGTNSSGLLDDEEQTKIKNKLKKSSKKKTKTSTTSITKDDT